MTGEGVNRKSLIRMTRNSKEKGLFAREQKTIIWKRQRVSLRMQILLMGTKIMNVQECAVSISEDSIRVSFCKMGFS